MTDLLTTEEAAEFLQMKPEALRMSKSRGTNPGKLGFRRGRNVMYRKDDLQAWAEGRLQTEEPETFGAADAMVYEIRGVNRRLDAILAELQAQRIGPINVTNAPTKPSPAEEAQRAAAFLAHVSRETEEEE